VFRAAPDVEETDLLAPAGEAGILGADVLTSAELRRRFETGARLVEAPVDGQLQRAAGSNGDLALFVVTATGDLRVAACGRTPRAEAGDTIIALAGAG
jgi:hypothetical protein